MRRVHQAAVSHLGDHGEGTARPVFGLDVDFSRKDFGSKPT